MSLKRIKILKRAKSNLDLIGVSLSGVCMIHCLATPVLLILAPVSLPDGIDEMFHKLLFLGIGPVALLSGLFNYRKSRDAMGILALLTGFLVLVITFFTEGLFVIEAYHLILTLCGSALLTIGHWMNYCNCEDPHND